MKIQVTGNKVRRATQRLRPQGARPAIAVGNRHPQISLPAAFEAFRTILKKTGVNMASTVQLSATREMTTDFLNPEIQDGTYQWRAKVFFYAK